MRPTRVRALKRAVGGAERQLDHAGHAQGHGQLGREALHAAVQTDVLSPLGKLEQPVDAVLEILGIPENAHVVHHDVLHGVAEIETVFLAVTTGNDVVDGLGDELAGVVDGFGLEHAFGTLEVLDHLAADVTPGNHGFGEGVAAQTVEAVQVPARRFTGGEQALEPVGVAVLVRADAAHRIVLRRAHGDKLVNGVHAEEMRTDVVDFTQLGRDVVLAEVTDIQPQVVTVGALHAEALAHVLGHAPGNHVAGGKLGLLRLVVGHETVLVHVEERPAVAAAAFRHQNVGGHAAGGMELDGLHVPEGHDAGIQGADLSAAVADDGVGGGAVDAPVAAGGDEGRLGDVGDKLAVAQGADDGAHAALAVMDEGFGLHPIVDFHAVLETFAVEGVQHGTSRAVSRVTGTPFRGAAEGAGVDEPVFAFLFFGLEGLAALIIGVLARDDAVPRHAPMGHFTHDDGRAVREDAGHFLIAAPVGTLHGVGEVDVGAVALAHDGVAEGRLHTTLRRRGMRPAGRDDGKTDGVETFHSRGERHAFAGKPGTNAQHVGINRSHDALP